ncbi:MAG: head-tail connector protein [Clostridium celatum]|jgi:uncharacterized phage protein (predicted DNA packaging)|nr:head-tail connector protein [Clostridium celatum]DAZ02653.1 MAG TPA: hypothetical protein [Caudoviricetes sp.]
MYTILSSDEYRTILANNPTEEQIEKIKKEINSQLQDVISFCKVDLDDVEELIDIVDFTEIADIYIESTVGPDFRKSEKNLKLARILLRRLVNSMYFNRSYEIASSAKTDIITRNILSKLSNLEEI